jgi:DNA-binding PadR family transcriptional regulator
LQIDILGCLALRGKLSKGLVESTLKDRRHGDILKAFDELERKGLIQKDRRKFGRGRRQFYYKITDKGVELLISYEPTNPLKFWRGIFGYCHHYNNDGKISYDKIENLYQLFMKKYLKYPSHGFSFQLDIFDNMRDKWFKEYILNSNDNNNKINPEQKVIEVLAIYPKLTFEDLVEKTKEGDSEISKVLSSYTLESYKPLVDENEYYTDQNIIGKKYNKKYWDFLLHNTVIVRQNGDGIKTYDLSLFGVILALTLVRYYDTDKLNHGLYYRNISFSNYYDEIASNYQDKLPLIFGKWNLLKDILRLYAAYNFDIILDKEIRLRESDKLSIIRGGNKELYDGIREIILQTLQQLGYYASVGLTVWLHYNSGISYELEGQRNQDYDDYLMNNDVEFGDKPDQQKVDVVARKVKEIMTLLDPLKWISSELANLEPEDLAQITHMFEEQFADEITAFYYIHLYYDHAFYTRISQPTKYYSSINQNNDQSPISARPKGCLSSILQNDKEEPSISEWYYKWLEDITNLQEEIYKTLKLNL